MDPNQASTRTSRRTIQPSSGNTAITTQSVVKKEEDDDDDDGTYRPRPRLQEGSFYMRTLADLMSRSWTRSRASIS